MKRRNFLKTLGAGLGIAGLAGHAKDIATKTGTATVKEYESLVEAVWDNVDLEKAEVRMCLITSTEEEEAAYYYIKGHEYPDEPVVVFEVLPAGGEICVEEG